MTHAPSHEQSRRAPIVVLVTTTLAGAGLFVACALDQLTSNSIQQSIPSLASYGLAFLIGLPVFASFVAVIWKAS